MFTLEGLFAGRTGLVELGSERIDLSLVELGEVQVPSGRLGASDPFVTLDHGLEVAVPPGSYPVVATVADVSEALDGSHRREAYLSVIVGESTPVSIESAVPPGEERDSDPDVWFGVPVDAGTVAFADVDAVARCMPEGNWYDDFFEPDEGDGWFSVMDDPEHIAPGCANIVMPLAAEGENVVLCHSGWGDGFYPVLVTRDAQGDVVGVHIDLQVVEPGHDEPQPEAAAAAPPPVPARKGLVARLLGRG